jgi:PAS domain S-box-containing protein
MEKAQSKQEKVLSQVSLLPQVEVDLASEAKEKRLRILHVDDDVCFTEVSKNILSFLANFEVDTAKSAEEAFRKIRSSSYDAIVSDYEMPNKNGLDFLVELRAQKIEVPFLLLTGKGREEIAMEALNLGADGYVSKHGNPDIVYGELIHYIRSAVERKQAKTALSHSQEELEAIIMNAPIGISASSSSEEIFKTANAEFSRILGYPLDELRKLTFRDITYPEDLEESIDKVKELKAGKIPGFKIEKRYVRKDGSIIHGRVSVNTVRDKEGKLCLFIAQLEDITDRKKMEDALLQDRETLEAITENLGVGFGTISKDYRVLWLNRFIKNNVGNVEGKPCYSSLNTLDHICPDCGVRKVFEEGVEKDSHEYTQIGVNGKPYYVELIATPLKDKDGNVTAALEFVVDIAEKKQREKDLRESREEFKALFNFNPQAVAYSDENYRIININPKFTDVFGYTLDEIRGKNQSELLVPADLKQEMNTYIEKSCSQEVSFQTKRKRKDGSTLQVFVSLASVAVGGKRIGSVTVYTDMTDQVASEAKIEVALKQSEVLNEKLSVIGSFTRHDVRNKLMAIEGNAYLAKKHAGSDQKMNNHLDQIRLAVTSITRMLDFAKIYESLGSEQRTQIDVGKAIDQAASLFSGLKGAQLINECSGFSILADSMLTTVFHNLIDNSLKYGKNLTTIRISHREEDGSETIIYEDDGGGISEEDKMHLFTKGFGHGSGFGLYLIRRTCDIYGWNVKETGDFGKGAKFVFTIPASAKSEKVVSS